MGIWGLSRLERRLIEPIAARYMAEGMPRAQAQKLVRELLARAKKLSSEQGTDKLPANFGDIYVDHAETDPMLKEKLEQARRGGATDDDVRAYWNLHDLERAIVCVDSEYARATAFAEALEKGADPQEAAKEVNKWHPMFGYSDETEGEDRPIPDELSVRICKLWKMIEQDPSAAEEVLGRLKDASSYNAWLRALIRDGRI